MDTSKPMENLLVIPARLTSQRLPQKLLLDESGKALLLHTLERAAVSKLSDCLLVATDAQEIFDLVKNEGHNAMMTADTHVSGTDRVAEAAAGTGAKHIVNVQGDEPFIDPELIDQLFEELRAHPEIPMVTAAHPHATDEGLEASSEVTVVCNRRGEALYFSRSLVPFDRDGQNPPYLRHVGIYGYQRDYLLGFSQLEPGSLENIEKLEQLRALENGDTIKVVETAYEGFSVDTREDYDQFLNRFKKMTGETS